MSCHRIDELLELLNPVWQGHQELNLVQMLTKLADELGCVDVSALTDDMLIYHLKMRGSNHDTPIPGLMKDHEDDFKTAILRARGILKD